MNIALIMPRSTFLETPMVWQPLGLFYLAARLESLGHEVDFFDLNVDALPPPNWYDQWWISATAPQMADVKRIARQRPDERLVLGGPIVWANPESTNGIGYWTTVSGECDSKEAVERIVSSVAERNGPMYMHFPVSRTLDWVLPPVRRWSNKYRATMTDWDGNAHRMTTMFTSRGCPRSCAFCESGRHGIIWDRCTRYEPLEIVEEQIKECVALGYTGLAFYDDILPLNKKRTLELMEIHKKHGVVWRCFLRTDIICKMGGFEYLKALREGGLIECFVGVESADNRIKQGIDKETTIEQDTQVLEWCKELKIKMKTSFILGLPGESYDSMEATRRWILANRPYRVQVGRLIPFAGTPLGDHPEKYDIQYERQPPDEWFYAGDNGHGTRSFVSTSHLTVEQIDTYWHDLTRELAREGIRS